MATHQNGKLLKAVLSLSNALIFTLYIVNYDISSRLFLMLIYLALFFCISAIFAIKFSGKIFQFLQDIQITFSSVILLFVVFEFFAWLFPGLIPLQVRNYLAATDINKVRVKMVEYLDESPFVKLKPNTIIRHQGYRGTLQQFAYEWKTDSVGFKNLEAVSKKEQVDIVAVGNSFTEGMGVATEKTWSSILTANGYSTYNLGVQGYAPTQQEGSLRQYGLQLNPEYVIIGYCSSTFEREKFFFNKEKTIQNKQFPGGRKAICNIGVNGKSLTRNIRGEIRAQAKYVVSAVFLLARSAVLNLIHNTNISQYTEIKNSIYEAYKDEILAVGSKTSRMKKIERGSNEWKSTLSAYGKIIKMAKKINAKVILLYFPQRGKIYYKAASGKELPERYFEKVEAGLLKQFAEENNIAFLDPSERLRKYVEDLEVDNTSVSELPYLEIDGHMSNKGHELVADEILNYLKMQH